MPRPAQVVARVAGPPRPPTAATRKTLNWLAPPWTRAPTRLTPATEAAPATDPARLTCRRPRPAPARSAACPHGRGSRPGRRGRRPAIPPPRTAHGHGPKRQYPSRPEAGHDHGPGGARQTAGARPPNDPDHRRPAAAVRRRRRPSCRTGGGFPPTVHLLPRAVRGRRGSTVAQRITSRRRAARTRAAAAEGRLARPAGPGSRASTTRSSTTGPGKTSTARPPRGRGHGVGTGRGPQADGLARDKNSTTAQQAPTHTDSHGPASTGGNSPARRRVGPAPASQVRQRPSPASQGTGRSTQPDLTRSVRPGTGRPAGLQARASTGRDSTSRPSTGRDSTPRTRGTQDRGRRRAPVALYRARTGRAARDSTPGTRVTPGPGKQHRDKGGQAVKGSQARASTTRGPGRRPGRVRDRHGRRDRDSTVPIRAAPAPGRRPGRAGDRSGRQSPGSSAPGSSAPGRRPGLSTGRTGPRVRDSTLRIRVTQDLGRPPGRPRVRPGPQGRDLRSRVRVNRVRVSLVRVSLVRASTTRARGRRRGRCPGPAGRPDRAPSVPAFTRPARGRPLASSRDRPGRVKSSPARSSATPGPGRLRALLAPHRARTGRPRVSRHSRASRTPDTRTQVKQRRAEAVWATRSTALPQAAAVLAGAPPTRSTARAIRSSGNATARCQIPRRAARE